MTIISQDEGISAGLRRIYENVLGEVRKGSSLSAALEAQQVFPTLMLGMIRAGEGSGKLDQVAERLAIHYEKAHQMNQQVKSALMYPMILAILAVAVVIVIVTFVLPQFSDLFSTMDSLPGVTLALMAFSNFMVTKWYLMILGVAPPRIRGQKPWTAVTPPRKYPSPGKPHMNLTTTAGIPRQAAPG